MIFLLLGIDVERNGYRLELDPYPLKLPDKEIWEELIYRALEIDEYMGSILYWIRSVGAVLVKNDRFGYFIKPIIQAESGYGWESNDEWLEEKKNLVPYIKEITKLLKEIREEQEYVVF